MALSSGGELRLLPSSLSVGRPSDFSWEGGARGGPPVGPLSWSMSPNSPHAEQRIRSNMAWYLRTSCVAEKAKRTSVFSGARHNPCPC